MNMFKDLSKKNFYEYLGYGVAILVVAYVTSQVCRAQVGVIEGLTNRDGNSTKENMIETNVETLVQRNEDLKHSLYLNDDNAKNKTNYEDIIINLEEWADLETIRIISDSKCCKGDLRQNAKTVKQVNDLKTFKDSLERSMNYLDNH